MIHPYYKAYEYYPQFNFKSACPLSLAARVVYSYLAFRARISQGANLTTLRTCFPIRETAASALDELEKQGLVKSDTDRTYFAEPPADVHRTWFAWKAPGQPQTSQGREGRQNLSGRDVDDPGTNVTVPVKHWSDKIMSHSFHLQGPDWRHSLHALAVFNILLDFDRQGKNVSLAGIAIMLTVHKKTVLRAFGELERSGLFRIQKAGRGTYDAEPLDLPDDKENWLLKKEVKDVKHEPLWKKMLSQRKDISPRLLERIARIVKDLAKWYPDEDPAKPYPRSWISPWDFQVYPTLHHYVLGIIEEAVDAWDNTRFESPVPLIQKFLYQAVKTWRSRWEQGHWHNSGDWLNFSDPQLLGMCDRVREIWSWHMDRDVKAGGPEQRRRERERLAGETTDSEILACRSTAESLTEDKRRREAERRAAEACKPTEPEPQPEPQPEPPEPRQSLRFRDMF